MFTTHAGARALALAAVSLGLLTSAAAAQRGTLDQQQERGEQPDATIGDALAQTFTAGMSGTLELVELFLSEQSGTGAGSRLTVEIRSVDANGAPGGTVLASFASTPILTSPGAGWVLIDFAPPASVEQGTRYAIVARADSDFFESDFYMWWGADDPDDAYPAGAAWRGGDPNWSQNSFFDFAFKTYVTTNKPPDCSLVTASPARLEPATRDRFKTIALSGASDPDGDALSYQIDSVTQDEPVSGSGLGDDTSPDAQLVGGSRETNEVQLRAERNPSGDGRIYTIGYTVSAGPDDCSGTATVSVWRKKDQSAVDSGVRFDSLTGEPQP